MPILAESIDLDAVALAFFILPIISTLLALPSFWPSVRGHWSGPVLAAPSFFIGVALIYSLLTAQRKDQLLPGLWPFALTPLIVGTASIYVWLVRRPLKKGRD